MNHALLLFFFVTLLPMEESSYQPDEKVIWSSFGVAKKRARDVIYKDHAITFYCGCSYTPSSSSGGKIAIDPCAYKVKNSEYLGKRLEWEHVVPAYFLGSHLPCWTEGDEECGKPGRKCCGEVNEAFHEAEVDLHNLVPSVGEINNNRSNHPYGLVEGEPRIYGNCDFELGGEPILAEPRDQIRGDIARIWFYMIQEYEVSVTDEQLAMFSAWHEADTVDTWECERNQRILELQGNTNPFVDE